jgi:uncharacterized integral membrane protein
MTVTLIITFILVLLVTVFGFQNGMPLDVKFLFWNLHTSLIAVIFGSSIIGAAIVALLTLPKLVTKHLNEKRLKKKLSGVAQLSEEKSQASSGSK